MTVWLLLRKGNYPNEQQYVPWVSNGIPVVFSNRTKAEAYILDRNPPFKYVPTECKVIL